MNGQPGDANNGEFSPPSVKALWSSLCRRYSVNATSASSKIARGLAVLRVKVASSRNFTSNVALLQQEGRLPKQAMTTMRQDRRRAEDYLFLLTNIKPTLKQLRANLALLYTKNTKDSGVHRKLSAWGIKHATEVRAKAGTWRAKGPRQFPTCTEPLSVTRIRRIVGLCIEIVDTTRKATPAEKQAILYEVRRHLETIEVLQKPPYWTRPEEGPPQYEI